MARRCFTVGLRLRPNHNCNGVLVFVVLFVHLLRMYAAVFTSSAQNEYGKLVATNVERTVEISTRFCRSAIELLSGE